MITPEDPLRAARRRMVEHQMRARGLVDERVLAVMEEVPRERFVPGVPPEEAFSDRALSIELGQTISQPFMVAAMTIELDVRPGHRVLEIGTGSGYQTAVLSRLAGEVWTVERLAALQEQARRLLEELGFANVHWRVGDGTLGWPEEAPFDRIMVTAGAPGVPPPLVEQLAEEGRLVVPVGGESEQLLTVVRRRGGRIHERRGLACRFVRLIGQAGWPG